MNWKNIRNIWKKVWHFLWHEDSLLSWITSIILAFILIKFLVYPSLGLIFGTNLPVVAVISESMEHDGSFDDWWNSSARCEESTCTQNEWYSQNNISKENFRSFPFKNGFNKGDIMILHGTDYEDIQIGDVIVFNAKYNYPVIHRVIEKNDVLQTKGDHNPRQIEDSKLNEKYITKDQLIGKAWLRVPYLGYVKIFAVDLFECVTGKGCFSKK